MRVITHYKLNISKRTWMSVVLNSSKLRQFTTSMQQPSTRGEALLVFTNAINNPDASVGVCCSHKVVAVGFNTLCYDASVGVLNPPHE